jgi:DNA polymerase III sliding clamp (beta) subunit (PCNA family)
MKKKICINGKKELIYMDDMEKINKHYLDKKVKIQLQNNDFFNGVVVEEHPQYIVIIDKNGSRVFISFEAIKILRVVDSVENGGDSNVL